MGDSDGGGGRAAGGGGEADVFGEPQTPSAGICDAGVTDVPAKNAKKQRKTSSIIVGSGDKVMRKRQRSDRKRKRAVLQQAETIKTCSVMKLAKAASLVLMCPNPGCSCKFRYKKNLAKHIAKGVHYGGIARVHATFVKKLKGNKVWETHSRQAHRRVFMAQAISASVGIVSSCAGPDASRVSALPPPLDLTIPGSSMRFYTCHDGFSVHALRLETQVPGSALKSSQTNSHRSIPQLILLRNLFKIGHEKKEHKLSPFNAAKIFKMIGTTAAFAHLPVGLSQELSQSFTPNHHGFPSFPITDCLDESSIKGYFGQSLAQLEGLVRNATERVEAKKRTYLQIQFVLFCKEIPTESRNQALQDMNLAGTVAGSTKYKGFAIMEETDDGSPLFRNPEGLLKSVALNKEVKVSKEHLKEKAAELLASEDDATSRSRNERFQLAFRRFKK